METLVDFAAPDGAAGALRAAFGKPRCVLAAHSVAEVRPLLDAVEQHAQAGRWCVGYVRYEAAPAFDAALQVHAADGPLAWFGVHDAPLPWPQEQLPAATLAGLQPPDRAAFNAALAQIHAAIAAGEVYQVNHTARLEGKLESGSAQALFHALQRAQPGGYAAYIDADSEQVLSVSPELFFDWTQSRLLTRPMKGTAPRGSTPQEDAARAQALQTSAKERAENVMVVDMLRNDVSRVALPHSVRVPRLFHLEALPSVWQMTSDVTATTRPGTTLADVFAALFPCGSVTGAPKVRAMQLIRALEGGPRGVYCGAVGVVRPGGDATFNVAIRTVTLQGGQVACGIGSGITADALSHAEWREWRHKRAFLERASAPFALLETLALVDGVCRDAPLHLARMAGAAAHFGYPWNDGIALQAVHDVQHSHPSGHWRVRLLLQPDGSAQAQAHALPATLEPVRLQLAGQAFEMADSEFTRFKTTRRAHYDAVAPTDTTIFDTLLWNDKREITECTRGNIALLLDGQWVTPPLHCGLLPGVGRAKALEAGRLQENVVMLDDLPRVAALAFVNSLRGWLPATLVKTAA